MRWKWTAAKYFSLIQGHPWLNRVPRMKVNQRVRGPELPVREKRIHCDNLTATLSTTIGREQPEDGCPRSLSPAHPTAAKPKRLSAFCAWGPGRSLQAEQFRLRGRLPVFSAEVCHSRNKWLELKVAVTEYTLISESGWQKQTIFWERRDKSLFFARTKITYWVRLVSIPIQILTKLHESQHN